MKVLNSCMDCNKALGMRIPSRVVKRCKPCNNKNISIKKARELNNINHLDFIEIKSKGKCLRKYRTNCAECGADKGYKRLCINERPCLKCSIKKRDYKTRSPKQKETFNKLLIKCKEKSYRLGMSHSSETKKILSKKQKEYCKEFGNQFKGKTHTNKTKNLLSSLNSGKDPQWKGRVFEYNGVNGKFKMRSSWELAYSKWLDSNKIKWLYEPRYILNDGRTFSPDFILENGEIHEVKGYWTKKGIDKWERFKETFPKIKTKIIDKDVLNQLKLI